MDYRFRNILRYLLSAMAAGALLYFAFRGVQWGDFVACLRSCSWQYVALAMGCCALAQLVRGFRWKMLLDPVDPQLKVMATFNAVNICMITNLVLPRAGELVRCGYITKHSGRDGAGRKLASYDKVFGTVVLERVWDTLMMAVFLVLLLSLMWRKYGAFFRDNIFSAVQDRLHVGWALLFLLLAAAGFLFAVRRFRDRSRFCARVYGVFRGIADGFMTCLHLKNAWAFLLYTFAVWGLYWVMSASILWAVNGIDPAAVSPEMAASLARLQGLTLADALFLMFAGALSSVVPVPGGFGAFHTVVAGALLSVYGVPFSLGIIFATLSHESQTLMQILLGLFSFGYESIHP